MSFKLPAQSTLDKYGLTLDEWLAFVPDGVCPVCELPPSTGRFVVDHEHVKGWKDMPSEGRRKYVRGVTCISCNHFVLTRYTTPLKSRNAATYLERYLERKHDA